MTDTSTMPAATPVQNHVVPPGAAALAGAVAAGLALAITELLAGLIERVPSAVAAVVCQIVDDSPTFVKDFAIEVFGTADKGALAIGTAITAAQR